MAEITGKEIPIKVPVQLSVEGLGDLKKADDLILKVDKDAKKTIKNILKQRDKVPSFDDASLTLEQKQKAQEKTQKRISKILEDEKKQAQETAQAVSEAIQKAGEKAQKKTTKKRTSKKKKDSEPQEAKEESPKIKPSEKKKQPEETNAEKEPTKKKTVKKKKESEPQPPVEQAASQEKKPAKPEPEKSAKTQTEKSTKTEAESTTKTEAGKITKTETKKTTKTETERTTKTETEKPTKTQSEKSVKPQPESQPKKKEGSLSTKEAPKAGSATKEVSPQKADKTPKDQAKIGKVLDKLGGQGFAKKVEEAFVSAGDSVDEARKKVQELNTAFKTKDTPSTKGQLPGKKEKAQATPRQQLVATDQELIKKARDQYYSYGKSKSAGNLVSFIKNAQQYTTRHADKEDPLEDIFPANGVKDGPKISDWSAAKAAAQDVLDNSDMVSSIAGKHFTKQSMSHIHQLMQTASSQGVDIVQQITDRWASSVEQGTQKSIQQQQEETSNYLESIEKNKKFTHAIIFFPLPQNQQ